jgi:hypothetical protein
VGLLAPWFLAGALAVGLPLWLHLLRKHKTTPLPFSSLMFFERRTQSSVKHRRLRYLMLLALRVAVILLLALAFAKPYLRRSVPATSRTGEVALIAVDNSLSMRAGGRLDEAKRMAKAEVGKLGAGHRAQVLAFGARVEAMSEVTGDRAALSAAVDSIAPSDERTSFAELSRAARSIAQSLKLPVRLLVFSDMQQSGMPPSFNDLRLNAAVRLQPYPVAGATPNFAVENVVAPRRVYGAGKTRVLATVAAFGTAQKSARKVTLLLNGRAIETKTVEVPASGRAAVEFLSLDVPHGRNRGEVRIDAADTLAADDSFSFSTERADPRRALFVHEADNARGLLYFKAALESSGEMAFSIDDVPVTQAANLDPAGYAFVVLSDVGALPAAFEGRLREYVRSGGAALIALGHMAAARARVPVSGGSIAGTDYAGREGALFQTAAWLDATHPAILNDNRWDDVKFYQSVRVDPAGARVAARLSNQTPLLLDQPMGAGRVLVFASTFDNVANDFPLHASFAPFVEQAARYLGRLDQGPSSLTVGSFAELRAAGQTGGAVEVLDPRGKRALSLGQGATASSFRFEQTGFYDIQRPGGRDELVAVNADRRESDLTPSLRETLALWQNTASGTAAAGGTVEGEQGRVSLWWYALAALLALALAESLLGNRHLSGDQEAA